MELVIIISFQYTSLHKNLSFFTTMIDLLEKNHGISGEVLQAKAIKFSQHLLQIKTLRQSLVIISFLYIR